MSHYRRRAGLCAPLFLAVSLRIMMGMALLQFALPIHAQAPAPLPSVSTPSTNLVLLPDRGNVTILKLDDQLRVGQPIADGQALTFTSSDFINGVYADYTASGPGATAQMKEILNKVKSGQKVLIEEVKVQAPDGVRKISGCILKIK